MAAKTTSKDKSVLEEGDAWVEMAAIDSGKAAALEDGAVELMANAVDANMPVRDAFCYYYKAVFWSFLISNSTIMESYDLILNSLLIAFPGFQRSFGERIPSGEYSISAPWQVALKMSVNIGLAFGVVLNGWLSYRWSPRYLMMAAHVAIVALVFVQFFAKTVEVVFAGTLLVWVMFPLYPTHTHSLPLLVNRQTVLLTSPPLPPLLSAFCPCRAVPCGMFVPATSAYAAELCPTKLRGYMTT